MKYFTDKDYESALNSERVSLIFFTREDCHLCVKLKPILKKMEKKYSQNIDFYFCDVKKEKLLTKHMLKESGVPTGFVLNAGKVFKIKDPEEPNAQSWYGKEYLEKIIKVIIG